MQIADKYSPQEIESKWYDYWMEHRLFHSEPDEREPYTIVIPPPNVTGMLHMGHMLNNTLQDVLVRRARMQGKNACWVPGTDHASLATRVCCDLYEKGLIYRGVRMVNWDPSAQTALSDEEVVFKESHGKLYYLRYRVEGTDRTIIVATTRPETILGDTVGARDPRYVRGHRFRHGCPEGYSGARRERLYAR